MDQLATLIETLRTAPADRIVDVLRALHGRRDPEADRTTARPRRDENGAPTRAARPTPRAIGDRAPRTARDRSDGARSDADRYDDARAFFIELEKRLRRERTVSETLIDGLRQREQARTAPATPAAQQLLRIVAVEGTPGAGRFVVTNPSARETTITLAVRCIRARATGTPCMLSTALEPARVVVPAEGWCRIRLTVDPAGTELRAGEPLELCIEGRSAGRLVMKLWVEVDVYPREAPGD